MGRDHSSGSSTASDKQNEPTPDTAAIRIAAMQITVQLPSDQKEALAVLDFARMLVTEIWHGTPNKTK